MLYYNRIDVSDGIDVNKTSYMRNALFATITIFSKKDLSFCHLSAMVGMT